jgi:hypothetical protein
VITRKGEVFFMADTSVNIEPTAEDLAEIALCTAHMARRFDLTPRVAMLSFSSFGGVDHPICAKVRKAVELIKYADPMLIIDGEIMADEALSPELVKELYPYQLSEGRGECVDLPRPGLGQPGVQTGGEGRRRRTDRANSDGHEPASPRSATYRNRGRSGQCGCDCGGRCTRERDVYASTCARIGRA